jgi:predicted dehydrogenase
MQNSTSHQLTCPELINDEEIQAVYICVRFPTRVEWTMRALANGKHVLLDTPAVGNSVDAERLFSCAMLKDMDSPLLLESAPFRFHPSWREFEKHLDRRNIIHVKVTVTLPAAFDKKKDLNFRCEHSGGPRLGLTYAMSVLRAVFGSDPTLCTRCEVERGSDPQP